MQSSDNLTGWVVSRRSFLKASAIGLSAMSLSGLEALAGTSDTVLRFGVFTDSHYADKETPADSSRFYRESIGKVRECIELMNEKKVDFLIELGDFKDAGPGCDVGTTIEYLKTIEKEFANFEGARYHVVGNHDVDCISKRQFLENIENSGQEQAKGYYSFERKGIHFVVLDANYHADGSNYNAGNFDWTHPNIPSEELEWLRVDLARAAGPVIVFLHQLLDGEGNVYVDNAAEVRAVLEGSKNVAAVFNGHHHSGSYSLINGIHYCTLKAVIEGSGAENSAYAVVEIHKDSSITVTGYRRQESMELAAKTKQSNEDYAEYNYSLPLTVRGRVYDEASGKGIGGVRVTDGVNIVTTNGEGKYELTVTKGPVPEMGGIPIISICTPSGKRAVNYWFRKINEIEDGEVDFGLVDDDQSKPFNFIHLTDTHYDDAKGENFEQFLRELGDVDGAKFIFHTGDVCLLMDGQQCDVAEGDCVGIAGQLEKLNLPFFAVPGNHDLAGLRAKKKWDGGNPKKGYGLYTNLIGPVRFSFDYGDIHFAGVDFNRKVGEKWEWGVPEEAIDWLDKDLSFVEPGRDIYLFMHYPQGHERLAEVIGKYNVTQIFHGHDHVDREGMWYGTPTVSSGSLAYLFSYDAHDRQTGYRIVRVGDGDGLDWFYKANGNDHAINLTEPRFEDSVECAQTIAGEFYDPKEEIDKVTVGIGNVEEQVGFYRGPVSCKFKARLKIKDAQTGFRPIKVTLGGDSGEYSYENRYLTFTDNNPVVKVNGKAVLRLEVAGVDVDVTVKVNDKQIGLIAPTEVKGDTNFSVPVKNATKVSFELPGDVLRRLNKVELIAGKRPVGKNDRFCVLKAEIEAEGKSSKDLRYKYGAWSPRYISNSFCYWIDLRKG